MWFCGLRRMPRRRACAGEFVSRLLAWWFGLLGSRPGRLALAPGLVCLLAPAAAAQPVLWGTAAANGTFPNGRLLRIDYATGTVQAAFNGPPGVTIGDGFTGVAVRPDTGQVFVTDGAGTNNVYRFNPDTGAVLGSFVSPTGADTIDGLEFLGNVLYASRFADGVIVRINPDTGAMIDTLPNPSAGGQSGLTVADGVIFSRGNSGNTTIARRSLTTGAVLSEFPTPNNEVVTALATDGESLYAASATGTIYRCDFMTGAVLDLRPIGIPLDGLGGPVAAPVPEPANVLLVCAGAAAVLRWRRGRGEERG